MRTAGAAGLLATSGLVAWAAGGSRSAAGPSWPADSGYGPLRPARDETTGLVLLHLPEGFRYRSLGWTGEPMSDGRPTPELHDGMGVVGSDGSRAILIRNHEITSDRGSFGPEDLSFDGAAGGGCTRLLFDTERGELVESGVALAGTLTNCAGGPTPWGSWLSCEEIVVEPGAVVGNLGRQREVGLRKRHGYVFEVPGDRRSNARPLVGMGRFQHEAAAVDPADGVVYLTEDNDESAVSGFYRYLPEQPGELAEGGRLQMMKVVDRPDLRREVPLARDFDVRWVDIENPERGHNPGTRDQAGVSQQGLDAGATAFIRLEGCWYEEGLIYFTSTSGGDIGRGQVFRFDPIQQTIRLIYESRDPALMDYPDNITMSPNGTLVICEDGARNGQMMLGLSPDGALFPLASNQVLLAGEHRGYSGDFRKAEWCGACFSPDGRWLFANVQKPGITFAITGPFAEGP